ncbi:type II secretion system protein N [Microbulbifer bruguierae]|uniref:Type II secretion system protein N n=1 Tax=Microbulbifer bruguierae TaxID=3029061 RepID=A0ABY8NED3_9GAMM|nr:type II secretion system protein N [Microbulbifer bruguierae]WGL17158.1 type II secretion system protein N [Microbulbifer bruguierae]
MSLVKHKISSALQGQSVPGGGNTARRSLLATSAVIGGWLAVNLMAYGSLAVSSEADGGLLAERSTRSAGASPAATLPTTAFFGVAAVKTEAEPELDLANIPFTQLNLVLSGVLSSSVKDHASALVAERGKPAERVYVGHSLPGGAEVYSVEVDHIILRRNGQMEKLTYPDADGRPSVPKQYANYARAAAEVISASAGADRSEKQQSIRERLEQLREMARERRDSRSN